LLRHQGLAVKQIISYSYLAIFWCCYAWNFVSLYYSLFVIELYGDDQLN